MIDNVQPYRSAARMAFKQFEGDFDRFVEIRGLTAERPWKRTRIAVMSPEFRVIACFRFSQASEALYRDNKLLGFLPFVVGKAWHRFQVATSHVHISPHAKVGPGLAVMHNYSILIGPATIGPNCVLHHNVTIGDGVAGGSNIVPSLGAGVWIGPGVTIAGDVSVGDNVTISAGTVLTRSVPDGCLVAGNPGRVVQLNYQLGAQKATPESGAANGLQSVSE